MKARAIAELRRYAITNGMARTIAEDIFRVDPLCVERRGAAIGVMLKRAMVYLPSMRKATLVAIERFFGVTYEARR